MVREFRRTTLRALAPPYTNKSQKSARKLTSENAIFLGLMSGVPIRLRFQISGRRTRSDEAQVGSSDPCAQIGNCQTITTTAAHALPQDSFACLRCVVQRVQRWETDNILEWSGVA